MRLKEQGNRTHPYTRKHRQTAPKLVFDSGSFHGPGSHHIHDGERAGGPIRHVEEALESGRTQKLVHVLNAKLARERGVCVRERER